LPPCRRGAGMSAHEEGFKIFVSDLPPDITQEELRTVFSTYGPVGNILLLGPQVPGSQRSALLFYAKQESAEDAIKVLNGIYKIRADAANPIKVSWARDTTGGTLAATQRSRSQDGWKLFVGGLPRDCTQGEVEIVFATYGKVNTVHLMQPHAVSGRVAGFVFYDADTSADNAIKALDGVYKIRHDAESPLTVKWAQDKSAGKGGGKGDFGVVGGGAVVGGAMGGAAPSGSGGGRKSADGWKLFVGGLPKDVTEQELTTVFSTYGPLSKVMVMQPHAVNGRVAAFVFYEVESAAEDAIKVLDGIYKIRVDAETPIQVRWAQDKNDKGGGKGGCGGASASWGGGKVGGGGGQAALGWQDPSGGWNSGGGWQQQGAGWQGGGKGDWQGGGGWGGKSGGGKGSNDWSSGGGSWSNGGGDWNRPQKGDGKGWQSGGKGGEVNPNKLFVGNLPPDITEETLGYVFNSYGKVTNIHVMTGKSRTGQACAFVEYASAADADTAVLTLHEKYEIKPGTGTILVKKSGSQNRSRPY